jgi:hypothetical protein
VADAYFRGAETLIAAEGIGMMESSFITLSKQFYYGVGNDAGGHPGVNDCIDPSMVIDAGGGTAGKCTSVYAVRWGMMETSWLWGLKGQIALSPVTTVQMFDKDGKPYTAYHQEINARPGLQVASKWSVAKIKNIEIDVTSSTHTLTDKLLGQLKSLFPDARQPHYYYLTQAAREQLRASRTATNPTGTPPPTPTDFEGVPLKATFGINNTDNPS